MLLGGVGGWRYWMLEEHVAGVLTTSWWGERGRRSRKAVFRTRHPIYLMT